MNLHLDSLLEGYRDQLALYKQGESIFEMGSGAMFPTSDRQQSWQFSRGKNHIRLSDGTNVHHFNVSQGGLNGEEADLERVPDVPLPDLFKDSTSKGRAQVHRSDPASVYFTLQEGTRNPTYTFRHIGGAKWKAIPKKKTAKQQLAQPATIPNVNAESFVKAARQTGQVSFDSLGSAIGGGIQQVGNGLVRTVLSPGEIRTPSTNGYGQEARPWQYTDALSAAALGAGAGALYHGAKRQLYNTKAENDEEDQDSHVLAKRIAIPALALGGANAAQNSLFDLNPPGTPPENRDVSGYYDQLVRGRPYTFFKR